jgi:hypothetical protein
MKVKAIIFGTCRIHDSAHLIHKTGCFDLVDSPLNHYVHTSSEICQYLRYITGDLRIETDWVDLIYSQNHNKPVYSKINRHSIPAQLSSTTGSQNYSDIKNVDVAIVEISTLRRYRFNSLFFQENCINYYLQENSGLSIREDHQVRDLFETPPSSRLEPKTNNQVLNQILSNCIAEYMTESDIENDLRFINSIFPKVIILSHFTTASMPPAVLESRQKLKIMIEKLSQTLGIKWFSVSDLINQIPSQDQLLSQGDFNHYSEKSKQLIASKLAEFVIQNHSNIIGCF